MSTKAPLSAIDILRQANKNAILEASFQIPIGDGNFLDAKLTAPDVVEIWQESELQRKALWAKAQEAGLVGKPINESEWREELAKLKKEEKEDFIAKKPKDLAEQYANQHAGINTVRNIIPRYIRDLDDNYLFQSEQDRDDFRRIMSRSSDIFKAISDVYVSLSRQVMEEKEAIKN